MLVSGVRPFDVVLVAAKDFDAVIGVIGGVASRSVGCGAALLMVVVLNVDKRCLSSSFSLRRAESRCFFSSRLDSLSAIVGDFFEAAAAAGALVVDDGRADIEAECSSTRGAGNPDVRGRTDVAAVAALES